jgi:hypothetical protein
MPNARSGKNPTSLLQSLCYSLGILGIGQVVRQRVLVPSSGVRIPHPQPDFVQYVKFMLGVLFTLTPFLRIASSYPAKITFMNQSGLTSQFSICLKLDDEATQAVDAIRKALPPSPYRDDTPHLTLARTIKTPSILDDKELLDDMGRLLELSKDLPLTATVRKPANSLDPLFRWFSSQLIIDVSPEIESYRKHILRTLHVNNYSVGLVSRLTFLPHISVRLGVPYTAEARAIAERSFAPGAKLIFNKWIILRDIKQDGEYLVREVSIQ